MNNSLYDEMELIEEAYGKLKYFKLLILNNFLIVFLSETLEYIDLTDLDRSWSNIKDAHGLLNYATKIDLSGIHNLFPAALIMNDELFIKENFKNFSRLLYIQMGNLYFKLL